MNNQITILIIFVSLLLFSFSASAADSCDAVLYKQMAVENEILQARRYEVLVQYDSQISNNTLKESLNLLDFLPIEEIMEDIVCIKASDLATQKHIMLKLQNNNNVLYVETNKVLTPHWNTPNDPGYSQQWGLHNIMAKEAWQMIGEATQAVIVAVIDSGIDATHLELQNRLAPGGFNFLMNNDDVTDYNGHGTAVAGIIAAETGNGAGIAGVSGTLDVRILPLKTSSMIGTSYVSDVIRAIDYAIEKNADVINISLGSNSPSNIEKAAIQRAIDNGIVVIASAGNSGSSSYVYPASYNNVISVGSIKENNNVSNFSNFNNKVTVTAPGEQIYTTNLNNNYTYYSGTSFSAAFVSGIASVIKTVDPSLNGMEIKELIGATAIDMGDPGRDLFYGFGRTNLKSAVKEIVQTLEPVTGVKLEHAFLQLEIGQEFKLSAQVLPENAENKNVSWVSDNPALVSVSPDGLVKAVGPGKATVIVITEDGGFTATCSVTVHTPDLPVSEITLDKERLTMKVGEEVQLKASVSPRDASNKNISWATDNPRAVTVDGNGLLTAVGPGHATIIVISEDGGKTATCMVEVTLGLLPPFNGKELNARENMETNKVWTIIFNKELDADTINSENVLVYDEEGALFAIRLEHGAGDHKIIVIPKLPYEPGVAYYLYITENISSSAGRNLEEPVRMRFTIRE